MSENKMGKYFKYAFGEIILVVIGILIALQINNWNEHRKVLHQEKVHLQNIKKELSTSLIELKSDLIQHQKNLKSTLNVYHYIQNKTDLVDSMYIDFHNIVRFNYFFPKTSTYETLKSGNLEVIQSDSLRELITDVYETGYTRIKRKVDTRRNAGRLLFPYYQKHFRTEISNLSDSLTPLSMSNKKGIPNNYEFIINDPEFETLIAEAIHGRLNVAVDFKFTIQYVESCISAIEAYLVESIL